MKELIAVFMGGGLGSLARFGLGNLVNSLHLIQFPLGTLTVNIFACFILGFLIGFADNKQMISTSTKLFWTVGFCGGFSTFSAFSSETLIMLQQGQHVSTGLYILASVILCVTAMFTGIVIARKIFP